MFTVELLPASEGDCIWVEWGDTADPHRMLIDAGHGRGTEHLPLALKNKLDALAPEDRTFDLVVASHIDVDHVHGLVPLFAHPPAGFNAKEVWFNSRRHLPTDELGYKDGNRLTSGLEANAFDAWNKTWADSPRCAVVVPDLPTALPERIVAGLKIVLLSPTEEALAGLVPKWPATVRDADLDPEEEPAPPADDILGSRDPDTSLRDLAEMDDDNADPSPSNRTSIAFLATYEDRVVLFGADAHADVLAAGLRRVAHGAPVRVDVCKVPHHGSRQNVKPELLDLLDCSVWLVSTNGAKHEHPDRRAMARILNRGPGQTLVFNYDCPTTAEFGKLSTTNEFDSTTFYSSTDPGGIKMDIAPALEIHGRRKP